MAIVGSCSRALLEGREGLGHVVALSSLVLGPATSTYNSVSIPSKYAHWKWREGLLSRWGYKNGCRSQPITHTILRSTGCWLIDSMLWARVQKSPRPVFSVSVIQPDHFSFTGMNGWWVAYYVCLLRDRSARVYALKNNWIDLITGRLLNIYSLILPVHRCRPRTKANINVCRIDHTQ